MFRSHERCFRLPRALPILLTSALLAGNAGAASAQGAGAPVRLELNRIEAVQSETCRVYLLTENASQDAYRSLRLDLFAFDQDGVVVLAHAAGAAVGGRVAERGELDGGQAAGALDEPQLADG